MKKKFSIIIPVAPDRRIELLDSLKRLNYPKSKFQIITVKGTNPSENRNVGADKAKGEIIGFLDDDAEVEPDFLKNVGKFFEEHKEIDIVGGPQLTPRDEKGFAKISGYALSSKFGAWNLSRRYSLKKNILDADETSITSANLFVKKYVMGKVKFDTKLFPGEDPKFVEDAKKAGFKVAYSPNFVIYHRRRADTESLMKQIFNYGKVRPLKEKFSDSLKKPFFLIPSLFVIYLLVIFVINSFAITGAIIGYENNNINLLFLPLITYIVLNIMFSLYESIKNKDFKAVFILPFIFPVIHLSYGLGMIWGYMGKFKK